MKAIHVTLLAALFAQACTSLKPTAEVRDGVYDTPSAAPVTVSAKAEEETAQADDYYDPNAAGQYQRSYYDMAYNDPYYYNYGRFGFGYGMGWGSPWQNASWNTGYGWGSPYYNNWNDPWNNNWNNGGWGYSGWGNGWNNGWGSPYGYGWNDPWYSNGYGYGNCYGGSGYYGYGGYGNGCGCYQPIVVYGAPPVIAHRPSLGSGGNGGTGGGGGSEGTSAMQPLPARPLFSLRPPMSAIARPALGEGQRTNVFAWPEPQRTSRPMLIERGEGGRQREVRPNVPDRISTPSRTIDPSPSRSTPGRDTGGGRTVQPRR